MRANHMILILLCWPCVLGEKEKPEEMLDQIALASNKSPGLLLPHLDSKTKKEVSTHSPVDPPPTYYQNSNGFVPMINYDSRFPRHPSSATNDSHSQWVNNPVFSTEARLLLSLPSSRLDRRSFQEQNDFEILKVNNDTPAIANYHDFYENLQKNLPTNSRDPHKFISDPSMMRTRDRIRLIDDYFNNNLDTRYGRANNPRYPQSPLEDVINKPSVFEPEKVHNNYHQYGASNYGLFSYSPVPPKVSNPGAMIFESQSPPKNERRPLAPRARHHLSKPVVIPEPPDYQAEPKYNSQQAIGEVSTPYPYVPPKYEKSASEDRYDRKEDYSDGSPDYLEITERPKRISKSRRRPETSRRPNDRENDEPKKSNSRTKSRNRVKSNYYDDRNQPPEDLPDDQTQKRYPDPSPAEETRAPQNLEPNVWSQVAPNVELSQSNGYEINQLENPNLLVPVNLNLVPISNFPHVPNAGVSGMITATPIISSTAAPLISTSSPMVLPKISPNPLKNYLFPSAIPEVIVGQNTFQSPVQAVLLPHMNKYPQNMKTQYLASTVAPMFTISQQFSPTVRAIHSTQSPKITTPANQYGPQLFLPQSTVHTFLPQTPVNTGNYNFVVNRGQNEAQTTNLKYDRDNSDKRNQYQGGNAHILTSASFSVSQDNGNRDGANNIRNDNNDNSNNKYRQTLNNAEDVNNNSPSLRPQIPANLYPMIRGAQVVPAIIHATNGISGVDLINQHHGNVHQAQSSISQPTYIAQIPKNSNLLMQSNNIFDNWRLQPVQVNEANKNRYQNPYGVDSLGSTTNNNAYTANNIRSGNTYMEQAQLPAVGMQTVEIRNPNINIKPSPVDLTVVNPLETVNHYATAVLTTPIPILSTTAGFLTPRPIMTTTPESISIQSYVDSLTQIGSQNTQGGNQANVFNPMNFIPNWDLIKSQTMLNSKVHVPRPLPQQLNLVPVVPGGNFDKHSPTAQVELINKPKLSSDLEKYAEEMFKESLRTIYNTHKWNTDKKVRNLTDADVAELERLKSDLSKFRAAMTGNYGKDVLEGHHSETKYRTVEPGKNSGLSTAAIEQLFKSDFKINGLPETSSLDGKHNWGREKTRISDYLTPPKVGSYASKTPFLDNISKKRPGKGPRYEGIKSRPHSKTNTRPVSPDTSASNHVIYAHRRPSHDRSNAQKGYKKSMKPEDYPSLTTAFPDIIRGGSDDKSHGKDYLDINHPRMHNLLGLLMKSKTLPGHGGSSYFLDEQENKRHREDERRYQPDEALYDDGGNFRKKSDAFGDRSHSLNLPKLENFHR